MFVVEIMLLCKVVDNYGDIGFVYRLARALSDLDGSLSLALVVSDLPSFAAMAPGVDVSLPVQRYGSWTVLDWNAAEVCADWCRAHKPRRILECFQCGRPEWLDDYLFCGGLPAGQTAYVINVEYLTAEAWADDFHLLKSGTRSQFVKKVNFMPGFTDRTGGLLLDRGFMALRSDRSKALPLLVPTVGELAQDCCNILVFSYKCDFVPLVRALGRYHAAGGRPVVYLAAGKGAVSFRAAYDGEGCVFPLVELPYLSQEAWDALLLSCDACFVRGEESFSRACLAGTPFLWQAYRQEGGFHHVKLTALLDRMRSFFPAEDFAFLSELFFLYNMVVVENDCAGTSGLCAEAEEAVSAACPGLLLQLKEPGFLEGRQEELLYAFLMRRREFSPFFSSFSSALVANGDLASRLLSYVQEFCS